LTVNAIPERQILTLNLNPDNKPIMKNRITLTSILAVILILVSDCKKDPPAPVVDFSFTGDNAPAPCQITFANSTSNASSYSWEFGDGSNSKEENPIHTYSTEGIYSVKLTAEGKGGTLSVSKSLVVHEPEPTAATINFTVVGDQDFEETIYPSVLLGLANKLSKSNEDFFDISVKNPIANSNLKIVIESTSLSSETTFQTQMATKGTTYTFSPLIKWNYSTLKSLNQPGNVDFTFVCYINDKEIERKNLRLAYRSANECVYGLIDTKGNYVDLTWMFAAFVNEDNPKIDEILKASLANNIVSNFSGYQGTETDVFKQVSALWYYLQDHSIKYSSITASSNTSEKVFSQYVRFFNDVYNNSQANCADGTIFLASILKKTGINPILIIVPGHMYLGYYTVQDKSKIALLETTAVGEVDLAEIYVGAPFTNLSKYRALISDNTWNSYMSGLTTLDAVKKEISYNHFVEATNYQIDNFNSYHSKFSDPNNYDYKFFDIEALRKIVQPIGNKK
jgi:PKD repeat protein